MMHEFHAAYPEIDIAFHLRNGYVDPIEAGVDITISHEPRSAIPLSRGDCATRHCWSVPRQAISSAGAGPSARRTCAITTAS